MMAGSREIRAGKAFIELTTKDSELMKGLKRAQARLNQFGTQVADVGGKLFGIGAAAASGLLAAANVFSTAGDELEKMSIRTGLAVEFLSQMKFAADQSGTSLNDVETSVKKASRAIYDAQHGLKTAKDGFSELGLNADSLAKLRPEDQFLAIADALANIADPSRRAALAMVLLGRSGTSIIPLIGDIKSLRAEADRLGITMTEQDAKSAADFNDAIGRVTATAKMAVFQIGSALAPTLQGLAEKLNNGLVQTIAWIKHHREMIVTALKVATTVAAIGGTLLTVGIAVKVAATAISGLTLALTVARGAMIAFNASSAALAKNPVIAVATAIGLALGWLVVKIMDTAKAQRSLNDAMEVATEWNMPELTGPNKQIFEFARTGKNPQKQSASGAEIEDRGQAEQEWIEKNRVLRAQAIKDDFERERQLLELRYNEDMRKFKDNEAVQSQIREAFFQEFDALRAKFQDRNDEAAKANFADQADAAIAEQERIESAEKQRAMSIEELKLQATLKGTALEEAMLELQYRRAIEAAKAAGESVSQVEEEFAIRKKLLGLKNSSEGFASKGLFNINALQSLQSQPSQKPLENIDKNTRESTKLLAQLYREKGVIMTMP